MSRRTELHEEYPIGNLNSEFAYASLQVDGSYALHRLMNSEDLEEKQRLRTKLRSMQPRYAFARLKAQPTLAGINSLRRKVVGSSLDNMTSNSRALVSVRFSSVAGAPRYDVSQVLAGIQMASRFIAEPSDLYSMLIPTFNGNAASVVDRIESVDQILVTPSVVHQILHDSRHTLKIRLKKGGVTEDQQETSVGFYRRALEIFPFQEKTFFESDTKALLRTSAHQMNPETNQQLPSLSDIIDNLP